MTTDKAIEEKLTKTFAPTVLKVVNESHKHEGHASSPGTGDSHFAVLVVSDAFDGKSRVDRHRLVNEALAEELAGNVHALSIRAMTIGEYEEIRAMALAMQDGGS
ncbi:BolA family protein [Methyloligella sp. 2.7D]|uniref:BolA family protein n=1 Tax=unclassified Methyloligella TaxID=2625955 RepID=UPI00157D48CA|nr:BolA family protein [Methyloligella sp. GL2]QKP76578.1 BolA family transcriptional regulator [Methyloligella sp. GL2]